MKESLKGIDNSCIFRQTFANETTVRAAGGVPTNVIFKDGVAEFPNSGTSYIKYNKSWVGVYSIRVKFYFNGVISAQYNMIYDSRRNIDYKYGSGVYITPNQSTLSIINGASHILYVNGVISNQLRVGLNDMIITCSIISFKNSAVVIGSNANLISSAYNMKFELLEIYNRVLTASEIKNLYNNKTNITLPSVISDTKKKIIDVNAYSGIIKNTLSGQIVNGNLVPNVINTDVTVVHEGKGFVMMFPSYTNLNLGNYPPLIGNVTIMAWVNLPKPKRSDNQLLFTNGQLSIVNLYTNSTYITNANLNGVYTTRKTKNTWIFIAITRTASGIVNHYEGNKQLSPILNSTLNEAGDTPVAGTSYMKLMYSSTLNKISSFTFYEGILSLDEITEHWSSTKQYL